MLSGLAVDRRSGRIDGFDFTFSKGGLRPNEIFDSATSPPARYVVELARRIAKSAPAADLLVIGNPLLPLNGERLAGWLQGGITGPVILSDQESFPLLYCLPRDFFADHERFLLNLSTVDAALDQRLLQALLGHEIPWRHLNNLSIGDYPLSTATGWFQGVDRQKLLKVTTAAAVKIIESRADWRHVPSAVYHPYHAGSVVFFGAASREVELPLLQRHVICSSFKDIANSTGSRLEPIWLKLPYLPRDASVGEPQYFNHSLDRLGEDVVRDNFLVFMRYSRSTGAGPFHRIDQDRFSLGESLERPEDLCQLRPPSFVDQCREPAEPLKVLFHITGGVATKTYPRDYCKVVMRVLRSFGIVPSVIGRSDLEEYGAVSIEADETDLLTAAVRRHHLFVGLDSFPHHYVRNVLGWPTIGLFGATGASSFGGGWHSHYRALDASLACHPCGAETSCPVFRQAECLNYVKPEILVAAIIDMAKQIYGFTVAQPG
jgi:hypothetical protein